MGKPQYIKNAVKFKLDEETKTVARKDGVLRLSKAAYRKMLKKHDCVWLNKFKGTLHEVGKLKFIEDGIEYEGEYAFWAKDWHVHMTKPIDVHLGRHMMYMLPITYWDNGSEALYSTIKNQMTAASNGDYNSVLSNNN